MSGGRVLFVRRAVADVAVENDQSGFVLCLPESLERTLDSIYIVSVLDSQNIPAVCEESVGPRRPP